MKNNTMPLLELLQVLSIELANFALSLKALSTSLKNENSRAARKLQSIITQMLEIKKIIDQTSNMKILALADQNYTNFCLLIFYGNLMADYLINLKKVNQDSLRHAHRWQNLVVQFKPFLERKIVSQ